MDNAKRFFTRAGNKSWESASKALAEFYGEGKRQFVWRSVVLAQTMHHEWLDKLDQVTLPSSWFWENPYFTGHGRNVSV